MYHCEARRVRVNAKKKKRKEKKDRKRFRSVFTENSRCLTISHRTFHVRAISSLSTFPRVLIHYLSLPFVSTCNRASQFTCGREEDAGTGIIRERWKESRRLEGNKRGCREEDVPVRGIVRTRVA